MQNWWLIGLHLIVYGGAAIALATPLSLLIACIGALFIWASVNDCLSFEIPDSASTLLLVLAAIRVWSEDLVLVEHVLGALIWPLLFWLTALVFKSIRGVDGLGFGDVKLVAAIGMLCGFSTTIFVVLAASVSAMVTMLVVINCRRIVRSSADIALTQTMMAFGPFLCFAAWFVILATQPLAVI